MQKTKLGVSVGLFGAALYLSALFGGFVAIILLAGYVLLAENNEWLRKTSVKAAALLICFSFLSALVGLIPDGINLIGTFASSFRGSFSLPALSGIVNAILQAIAISKCILFLLLGVKALNQGTVSISPIDKLIEKHM